MRDRFFEWVAGCEFEARGYVVRKTALPWQPELLKKQTFYDHFLKRAIEHCCADLEAARVILDGATDRTLRDRLKVALSTGSGSFPRPLSLRDSKADELVQLADMAAGAMARGHKPEGADRRWLNMLEGHSQLGRIYKFPGVYSDLCPTRAPYGDSSTPGYSWNTLSRSLVNAL